MSEYLSLHCCKPGREDNSVEINGGPGCLSICMFADSGLVVLSEADETRLLTLLLERAGGLQNLALAEIEEPDSCDGGECDMHHQAANTRPRQTAGRF